MKVISIIGSTGSIGTQVLEVARLHNIKIIAISANNNYKLLSEQAREFKCKYVCIHDKEYYKKLKEELCDTEAEVLCGDEGLCRIAELDNIDIFVNSVVGMVGLLPTIKAIENGTTVALANKETLVAGGNIVMKLAENHGVKIIPIDSEHSAIFQSLQGNEGNKIKKIILTASGGPFFGMTKEQLKKVSIDDALHHPNWNMGNKITIDSATLMNKGLEFIEARWLFNVMPEQIEVIVHRQSVLHSAVEYEDNAVIAELGVPDMKVPIQYALLYPNRKISSSCELSLFDYGKLTFEKADMETFVCLKSCIEAIKRGGAYPCILNGINEEAVKNYLDKKISFLRIGELVAEGLNNFNKIECESYEDVIKCDKMAREFVKNNI